MSAVNLSIEQLKAMMREVQKENQPSQPQEDHSSHVMSCPTCFKETLLKLKESDFECQDCHSPLGSAEMVKALESCPICGSKHAKKVNKR